MKKALVLGGGFTGCTWAKLLAGKGFEVTLVERLPWLGGGCKTFHYGGHPYTLGPRHLFTWHEHVFHYLEAITPMRRLNHYLLTYVEQDAQFYSYPPHVDDIARMPDRERILQELEQRGDPSRAANFEEYWETSVGPSLYAKFAKEYSQKMWQIPSNTELDDFKFDGKGVVLREGTHEVRPDLFIAYPYKLNGWDDYFAHCAATEGVTVLLDTQIEAYDLDRPAVRVAGEWLAADLLVSSISPDDITGAMFGKLRYVGRDFIKLVLPVEQVIPDPIYFLHYAGGEPHTRVVEYKKLTGYKAPDTLLGIEIPSFRNRLYPYPVKAEQDKAQRYLDALPAHVLSVGRMGNYRYMDIGFVVDEALRRIKDV